MKIKKISNLLIIGIILIILIGIITVCSKNFFDKRKPNVEKNELETVRSGDKELNLTEQTSIDDKSSSSITPYTFKIENKGNTKEIYEIVYEDFVSDDGKEHLNRDVLKYQLKSGDNVIKEGNLIDIKDNIITKEEINPKTIKKYELRIWVNESVPASEWVGKSYSYNILVNQISK